MVIYDSGVNNWFFYYPVASLFALKAGKTGMFALFLVFKKIIVLSTINLCSNLRLVIRTSYRYKRGSRQK